MEYKILLSSIAGILDSFLNLSTDLYIYLQLYVTEEDCM